MRTVTGTLAAQLIATATAPRFLLSLALSSTVRLSTHASASGAALSVLSQSWTQSWFTVRYTPGENALSDSAVITVNNKNGQIGGLLLADAALFPACAVGLYLYDGDAPGSADVVKLMGNSIADTFSVNKDSAVINVTTKAKSTLRVPSTRIVVNAVRATITPEGSSVLWNNERFEFRN